MSFTGNEEHSITLSEAADLTANYRNANPGATKGHYFGKTDLQAVLNQSNCVGIRVYYGQNTDGQKQLVIVGVDASENDLTSGLILDKSVECPPRCGNTNSLNS